MLIAIAAAGWLLAQAAAPAPPGTAPAPAPAAKAEKPKKPKLICVDETHTESFIPKRVCRTQEQIDAERDAARKSTNAVQDRLGTCRTPAC